MNITQGSELIAQALAAGQIDRDTAIRAQAAIRKPMHFGHGMTPQNRRQIVEVQFGVKGAV